MNIEKPVVELCDLTVRFGKKLILDSLSCSFSSYCIGLLGPNGAGKTTLLKTLLGFIDPSNGHCTILGERLTKKNRYTREYIGYMPEDDNVIPNMSAVRYVRILAELSGLPSPDAMERAHESLFHVGLGEARYRKIKSFSKGMRQRIKLAQAIVHAPLLLLLDEPTDGFDPSGRSEILRFIKEIVDQKKCHVIISTHLLSDVEELCDSVVVLNRGRIALHRDINDLKTKEKPVLELRIHGEHDSFAQALAQNGVEYSYGRNKKIKVILPSTMTTRDLFQIADRLNVRILELIPQRYTLEEIFFEALDGSHGTL